MYNSIHTPTCPAIPGNPGKPGNPLSPEIISLIFVKL